MLSSHTNRNKTSITMNLNMVIQIIADWMTMVQYITDNFNTKI
jgi:hypothetical protein